MLPFLLILSLWLVHLAYTLTITVVDGASLWTYGHVAVQAYLYTGLFITAHDAMHGTAVRSARGNWIIGTICAWLYAGMSYRRLYRNHHEHHAHPADDHADPDYHPSNNLVLWYASFMWRYATVGQFLIMGVSYNILALWVPESSLWVYWILPAFLSSFQLFFVGTYLPHRRPHTVGMVHNARSMRRNHAVAMLACYFFGYHAEHHASPGTPWWRLWRVKDAGAGSPSIP